MTTSSGREASLRDAMKWLSLSTELPIMVGLFAYVGYIIGKRFGSQYDILGLLVGGLIGFILGLFGLFAAMRIMGSEGRRKVEPANQFLRHREE